MWKHALRFTKQKILVIVARREVTNHQPLGRCVASQRGGLPSGGVKRFASSLFGIVCKGGLVKKQVYVAQVFGQLGQVDGVGAVGIGARGVRWEDEARIGPRFPRFVDPIGAGLDVADGMKRDFEKIDHVAADMRERSFLAK